LSLSERKETLIKKALRSITVLAIILLIAMTGCGRVQSTVTDTMPAQDATPVKLVWLVNVPENEKNTYISWTVSVESVLKAPQELVRIRTYANADPTMYPNLLVEFASFADASKYLGRPEIVAIMNDNMNYVTDMTVGTFTERFAYTQTGDNDSPIMGVYFINYLPGRRQLYLDWIESMRATTMARPQLKSIHTYENYYDASPHRFLELGYSSLEAVQSYLVDIESIRDELEVRTFSWKFHVFELQDVVSHSEE